MLYEQTVCKTLETLRKELPKGSRWKVWSKVSGLPLPGPLRARVLSYLGDIKVFTPLVTRGGGKSLGGFTPYKPKVTLRRGIRGKGSCKCGQPMPHEYPEQVRHARWMRAINANRKRWARSPGAEDRRAQTETARRTRLGKQHEAWLALVHPHTLKVLGREAVTARLATNRSERRRLRRRAGFNA